MNQLMDRREALRKTALLMGAAVSATALAGIMQGCKATPELTYVPSFFTEEQARID
jgi:gluconate 2-dehydrogenase gamma chain